MAAFSSGWFCEKVHISKIYRNLQLNLKSEHLQVLMTRESQNSFQRLLKHTQHLIKYKYILGSYW